MNNLDNLTIYGTLSASNAHVNNELSSYELRINEVRFNDGFDSRLFARDGHLWFKSDKVQEFPVTLSKEERFKRLIEEYEKNK